MDQRRRVRRRQVPDRQRVVGHGAREHRLDRVRCERVRHVKALPSWQPISRSCANCEGVSMPSEITRLPSELPRCASDE